MPKECIPPAHVVWLMHVTWNSVIHRLRLT